MSVSVVASPRFESTTRQASGAFRRTIGGNIVDLRRVGKSGSGLSLPPSFSLNPYGLKGRGRASIARRREPRAIRIAGRSIDTMMPRRRPSKPHIDGEFAKRR